MSVDVRIQADEIQCGIKDAKLFIHAVALDAERRVVDHVDVTLPLSCLSQLSRIRNFDQVDYRFLLRDLGRCTGEDAQEGKAGDSG